MLLGFIRLLDEGLLFTQKAIDMSKFFKMELYLVIFSKSWVSKLFSFGFIGVKKLKRVPAQYINNADTIQNS